MNTAGGAYSCCSGRENLVSVRRKRLPTAGTGTRFTFQEVISFPEFQISTRPITTSPRPMMKTFGGIDDQ